MTHKTLLACVLFAGLCRALPAQTVVVAHVRSTDPLLSALIAEAAARSPVMESLVNRLNRSDVVVYVEHGVLGSGMSGRLTFVGTGGDWRYVRVQIDCRQSDESQMVSLGHELRHAVEIADAAAVDGVSLARLYGVIGFPTDGSNRHFESNAAREAGLQVRRELHRAVVAAGN